jgi:trimeric autotransporter adhesin
MKSVYLNIVSAMLRKVCIMLSLSIIFYSAADAQTQVGAGQTYTTLKAAFDAINAGTLTGNITLQITSNITETASASLNASGSGSASYTSVTINPGGGAARAVTGNITTSLLSLNGADNVIIDGLNSSGNSLTFYNSNTTGVTILFTNDATNNTVTKCTVRGACSANTFTEIRGVISFGRGATGGTGNDNNTISQCDISEGNNSIWAYNSTAGTVNENITISGCNIYDYYSVTAGSFTSSGIYVYTGNSDWTISNNSFYQTTGRTVNAAVIFGVIYIRSASGNNFQITGNYIGGTAALAGGTAMTYNNSNTGSNGFSGIVVEAGTTTASSIQGNIITNINYTSAGADGVYNLSGIRIVAGWVNIGDISGNTIGSSSIAGAISINTSSSTNTFYGIYYTLPASSSISNNTVGGITMSSRGSFTGLNIIATNGSATINNNVIGSSTVSNSISLSSSTNVESINGIFLSCSLNSTVAGNSLSNITHAGSGYTGDVYGLRLLSAGVAVLTVEDNVVSDIKFAASQNAATNTKLIGIGGGSSTSGTTKVLIKHNTVHSLQNTNGSSQGHTIKGISWLYAPVTETCVIEKNTIHSLSNENTGGTNCIIYGIHAYGITSVIANNMIHLGYKPDGSSIDATPQLYGLFYEQVSSINAQLLHNTIFIGGTVTVPANQIQSALYLVNFSAPLTIKNNIFVNERSLTGGSSNGLIYNSQVMTLINLTQQTCVGSSTVTSAGSALDIDHNLYYNSGTLTYLGYQQLTFTNHKNTYRDYNSIFGSPGFVNKSGGAANVDLHISSSGTTPVEGAGILLSAVTTDIDGEDRSTLTATDIGADAGNFTLLDNSPPGIKYTYLSYQYTGFISDRVLSNVQLFDPGGIASGANGPRIYFRKNGGAWFSNAGSLVSSAANAAVYDFTIPNATIGGLVASDYVEYYIVAQDANGIVGSWPYGVTATDVNTITTPPTLNYLNRFTATPALNGTYTVGAGGNYTTIPLAFSAYNAGVLTGPVIFSLTDATYSLGSSTATITYNNTASATNTLTIKPASGVTATITSSVAGAVLQLTGADYITIDGSNNGTNSRNLTVTNNSTSGSVIFFANGGSGCTGGDGVTYSIIQNTNLTGNSVTANAGIVLGGSSHTAAGAGHNNNSFINNKIDKVGHGIYLNNSGTIYGNINIEQNEIGSATAASYVGLSGIWLTKINNSIIQDNSIYNIKNATTTNSGPHGILISDASADAITIRNNIIYGIQYTGSAGYGGKGIRTAGSGHTISNNIIFDIGGDGSATLLNSIHGIYSASTTTSIYHNTVYLAGNYNGNGTGANIAAAITLAGATNNIRNNIFHNQIAPTGKANPFSYAIYSTVTTANITAIDYNDYYVAGANSSRLGFIGSARATFADWKTGVGAGKDANSMNTTPSFVNTTVTTATGYRPMNGLSGITIAGFATDYGGTARASTPTMGAWEKAINEWMGTTGTDFATITNWSLNLTPADGQDIAFAATAANDLVLDQSRTVGNVSFSTANKKLVLGNFNLSASAITGTDADNYVQTNGTGKLLLNTANTVSKLFPVGNSTYNPVTITNNTGAADDFSVRILDEVYKDGAGGEAVTPARIIRTWDIGKTNANAGAGVNFSFEWSADQNTGISTASLYHYSNGSWSEQTNGTASSPNSTSFNYTGYTGSFSPFAILEANSTLPLIWQSFTAERQGETALLKWQTFNEQHTKDFTIQHSANGVTWQNAGVVNAAGYSVESRSYSFIHTTPADGINYYRLLQADLDGKYSYSVTQTLQFRKQGTDMVVYGNPVSGSSFSVGVNALKEVSLWSTDAKMLWRTTFQKGVHQINVGGLANGMYFLRTTSSTVKIIIAR